MTDREKLIARLNASFEMQYSKRGLLTAQHTADDLISFGVTFVTDNNVGNTPVVPGHDDQYNIAEMSYNNGYAKGLEDGKPKWIPVTERLPEPFEVVCVYVPAEQRVTDAYMTRHNEWVGIRMISVVTHWMELPEPPKEDGYE